MNFVRSSPLPSQWLLVLMHEGPLIPIGELFHGGEHGGDRVLRGDWCLLTTHAHAYPPRVEGCDQNTLRVQLYCKVSRHHVQCSLRTAIGVHAGPRFRHLSHTASYGGDLDDGSLLNSHSFAGLQACCSFQQRQDSSGEDEGGDAVHSKVLHHELLRHGFKIPKLALLVARIVDHKVETELANQLFEL